MNVMENSPEMKEEKIEVKESEESVKFASDPDQNWEKVKRW